jgi:hypothetical protein
VALLGALPIAGGFLSAVFFMIAETVHYHYIKQPHLIGDYLAALDIGMVMVFLLFLGELVNLLVTKDPA